MLDADNPDADNANADNADADNANAYNADANDTESAPAEPAEEPGAADPPEAVGEDAAAVTAAKPAAKRTTKRSAAKRPARKAAAESAPEPAEPEAAPAPEEAPAKRSGARRAKKATASGTAEEAVAEPQTPAPKRAAAKRTTARRTTKKAAAAPADVDAGEVGAPPEPPSEPALESLEPQPGAQGRTAALVTPLFQPPAPVVREPGGPDERAFEADDEEATTEALGAAAAEEPDTGEASAEAAQEAQAGGEAAPGEADEDQLGEAATRRRRRRGGRRRRRVGAGDADDREGDETAADVASDGGAEPSGDEEGAEDEDDAAVEAAGEERGGSTRRRRRRRRAGEADEGSEDDPQNTVTRVRQARRPEDEITGVTGSTRLEAKKQRRREGREAGRRRAPVISEAEFLARREAVERVMVIRQRDDLTQIAVLEDKVLVEHYVARESQASLIGNVYLGRVQNVLPSMEAAFIDIGKGRNAVLYAGEVNWAALGAKDGSARKIEAVLKPGQAILVQVTKDPVGHKGARLTSQVSLPGRFLVYVPDGTTSGISRKLPDTERQRLKAVLKDIVPDTAGVIVRTAAEGASEEELTRDVERLTARWADIETKVATGNAPQLLYGEPDLTLKVVRDLFTEDFARLVVSGDDAWETVARYVEHVAPDLADRLARYEASEEGDAFTAYRIDEQIAKALDRKVWLPSGGSLVIDRTEAMTVVDVNTGKFTGSGGNLEETVTKNNLEAAEEIVRQLRLRDIGGIIVVDFIDMVLESNRELVLRRLVECLGRDRTRHQVAEVTSLGLVQMTRKRIGTGLLEAFSEPCEACQGRGLVVHQHPVEPKRRGEEERPARRGRGRGGRSRSEEPVGPPVVRMPTPADLAAMARPDDHPPHGPLEPSLAEPPSKELAVPQPASTELAVPGPALLEPAPLEPAPLEPAPPEPALVEPEPAEPEPASPEPPRIITTTRRRGATRAAGPPVAVAAGSDGEPVEAQAHVTEADLADASWAHVPVKKKGSRKR
jgi:ribonuclease E